MRKKLLVCDGCNKKYPGELLGLTLQLRYHNKPDIADSGYSYDFCGYRCLGLWLAKSAHRTAVEEGLRAYDKGRRL